VTTDPTPHIFWLTSRAAGTAALLLASLGVCIGLLMGGRFVRGHGVDLRASHEAISLATLSALVVHALALLGDKFLHPSLVDLTVPFVSGYKTAWTTTGIVAGWGLLVLGGSFYARRFIGPRRWRFLHRFTVLFWALGVVHSVGEGTDARSPWFLFLTAVAVVPPTVLFLARIAKRQPTSGAPATAH
jgi:methionine sulfoxide reductase heme-binding subunit